MFAAHVTLLIPVSSLPGGGGGGFIAHHLSLHHWAPNGGEQQTYQLPHETTAHFTFSYVLLSYLGLINPLMGVTL